MGLDARFLKYPRSRFNLDTNAEYEGNLWEHPVSPYDSIPIESVSYIRNNHDLHAVLTKWVEEKYEHKFVNSADYQITPAEVQEIIDTLDGESESYPTISWYLSEVLADMVKNTYRGEQLYDYYYSADW